MGASFMDDPTYQMLDDIRCVLGDICDKLDTVIGLLSPKAQPTCRECGKPTKIVSQKGSVGIMTCFNPSCSKNGISTPFNA